MLELLDSNSRRSVVICGGEQGDMALLQFFLYVCVCAIHETKYEKLTSLRRLFK